MQRQSAKDGRKHTDDGGVVDTSVLVPRKPARFRVRDVKEHIRAPLTETVRREDQMEPTRLQ